MTTKTVQNKKAFRAFKKNQRTKAEIEQERQEKLRAREATRWIKENYPNKTFKKSRYL